MVAVRNSKDVVKEKVIMINECFASVFRWCYYTTFELQWRMVLSMKRDYKDVKIGKGLICKQYYKML